MPEIIQATRKQNRSLIQVILSCGFFASASGALVAYINSSFLETLIPKSVVGSFFALGYALAFLLIQYYGRFIEKFKNHVVFLTVLIVQVCALLLLSVNLHPALSLAAFLVWICANAVIVINFDVLLEFVTRNSETGRIRGLFWTCVNLAFVVAPTITGVLVERYGFSQTYFLAALVLIPVWGMIFATYRNNGHEKYRRQIKLKAALKEILADKNLRGIYLVALLLSFFYSFMVIYTPIYLLDLGLSWEKIGQIFTVMLIPFALIQYPAGWLADKYLGETEMLAVGFALMGICGLAMIFFSSFAALMVILFCSRVGAALVEIMRDTYFYKKVDADDLDLINLFRGTGPLAYVIGPVAASLLLAAGVSLNGVFVFLALVMFAATLVPLTMDDTL